MAQLATLEDKEKEVHRRKDRFVGQVGQHAKVECATS